MIYTYSNVDLTKSDFAPWGFANNAIRKGILSVEVEGINLPNEFLVTNKLNRVSDDKVFISYFNKNLDPKIVPSANNLTYNIILTTLALQEGEKVVFVKSEGGYVIEWHYGSIAKQFDAVIAFKEGKPSSVTVHIANQKGEVKIYKFERTEDSNIRIICNNFQKMEGVRTDAKLSLVPYRPFVPTELVFVHAKLLESAKKHIVGERYKFVAYQNLKEFRKLAEQAKADGYTVATHFFDVAGKQELGKDQMFFARVLSEYFKFIHMSFNNKTTTRYVFQGQTTIPKRKQKNGKKPFKPNNKKPDGKKPTPVNGRKQQPGKKTANRSR